MEALAFSSYSRRKLNLKDLPSPLLGTNAKYSPYIAYIIQERAQKSHGMCCTDHREISSVGDNRIRRRTVLIVSECSFQ